MKRLSSLIALSLLIIVSTVVSASSFGSITYYNAADGSALVEGCGFHWKADHEFRIRLADSSMASVPENNQQVDCVSEFLNFPRPYQVWVVKVSNGKEMVVSNTLLVN
jgi:hypothetical protein